MLYPIAIERGDEKHAFGVVVPDIPGCFSAGDTLAEALSNAKEAIETHLSGLAEDQEEIPVGKPLDEHFSNPDYKGWIWAVIDVDLTPYLGKAEKINITLPRLLLSQIDAYVATHKEAGSRSGFLADAAVRALGSARSRA